LTGRRGRGGCWTPSNGVVIVRQLRARHDARTQRYLTARRQFALTCRRQSGRSRALRRCGALRSQPGERPAPRWDCDRDRGLETFRFLAMQGDRGFDIATLLFYSYDVDPAIRSLLWQRCLDVSALAWTTVYLCHLILRQLEWSIRHRPGSAEVKRFGASHQHCWTTSSADKPPRCGPRADRARPPRPALSP
jgi:hypothetical protein